MCESKNSEARGKVCVERNASKSARAHTHTSFGLSILLDFFDHKQKSQSYAKFLLSRVSFSAILIILIKSISPVANFYIFHFYCKPIFIILPFSIRVLNVSMSK